MANNTIGNYIVLTDGFSFFTIAKKMVIPYGHMAGLIIELLTLKPRGLKPFSLMKKFAKESRLLEK